MGEVRRIAKPSSPWVGGKLFLLPYIFQLLPRRAPRLLEGCGGRITPGGDGGGPQSQRRQQQGQESAYMDLFHWYHLTDKPMR